MKEGITSESSIAVLPAEGSNATRVFKLMNRLAADELRRYKREQVLFFPFFISDNQLEDFAKDIIKAMDSVPSVELVEFVGAVKFVDLSSQRFNDFAQFLERAGKRQDPQSIKLTWSKFSIYGNGEAIAGQVDLYFFTEKPLKTGRTGEAVTQKAKVEIIVSGSDQRWVDQLFDDLIPMVKTTAHGGIMRPPWVFQNEQLVVALSALMAAFVAVSGFRFASKHVDLDNEKQALQVVKVINATNKIEDKFSLYVNWQLSPKPSHFAEFMTVIILVIGFSGLALFTLLKYIPMLTPSSAVAIGTAKRRAISAADVFKFILFTIIVGGFIIPLLRAGISLLWDIVIK